MDRQSSSSRHDPADPHKATTATVSVLVQRFFHWGPQRQNRLSPSLETSWEDRRIVREEYPSSKSMKPLPQLSAHRDQGVFLRSTLAASDEREQSLLRRC